MKKGEQTKERIVLLAIDLFKKQGFFKILPSG
jgi:hypothetical protein